MIYIDPSEANHRFVIDFATLRQEPDRFVIDFDYGGDGNCSYWETYDEAKREADALLRSGDAVYVNDLLAKKNGEKNWVLSQSGVQFEHQRSVDGKWHPGPSDYTAQPQRIVIDDEDKNVPPYHDEMQCFVSRIGYDFGVHVGQVLMSDGGCTDMSGCINFFKRIDPEVNTIRTYSDQEPDTVYFVRNGEWHAAQGGAEG